MLDSHFVLEQTDAVRQALARRNGEAVAALEPFLQADRARRELQGTLDRDRAERNRQNEVMKRADKSSPDFARSREALRELSQGIKAGEDRLNALQDEAERLLLYVPNPPDPSVPDGKGAEENPVVATWGERPSFSFPPKQHFEIGEALGLLDFERAAKISGARFAVLRGAAARLERALMMFMLDTHTARGYREIWPPFLVKREAMEGTGHLPKFEDDAFKTAGAEYFLVPTAEVPVTNLHREEILEGAELPIRYCAYTPCFRAEAGSYGKDTRGLIRQHQFDKVELVHFVRPEESPAAHEALRADAEEILRRLGLHYRVVELCAGDLGFGARKCYDLEVWLPGQEAFREISSCSNFGDFQARRAKIRYRPGPGEKARPVHTLNGSGLAIGRTLVAIFEQFQQADGTVRVPEALRPYMGGLTIIGRA